MLNVFRNASILPVLRMMTAYRRGETLVNDWDSFRLIVENVCCVLPCATPFPVGPVACENYSDVPFAIDPVESALYLWTGNDFVHCRRMDGWPARAPLRRDYTFGVCLAQTTDPSVVCVLDVWMYGGHCIYSMCYDTVRSVYAKNLNREILLSDVTSPTRRRAARDLDTDSRAGTEDEEPQSHFVFDPPPSAAVDDDHVFVGTFSHPGDLRKRVAVSFKRFARVAGNDYFTE